MAIMGSSAIHNLLMEEVVRINITFIIMVIHFDIVLIVVQLVTFRVV